jgi:hypothetical protein
MDVITRFMVTVADDAQDGGRCKARGGVWPHPYLVEMPTAPTYDVPLKTSREGLGPLLAERLRNKASHVIPPSKDMVELMNGIMTNAGYPEDRHFGFMGTGAAWYIQKAIFVAAGVDPETWGVCPVCKGEAIDPAVKEAYDNWKETPVPEGPGYQLWETISEGSPISPVFPTEEGFIQYLVSEGSTRSAAESFVKSGWTPSGVIVNGKMTTGIGVAEALEGT